MITEPIDSLGLEYQAHALSALTKEGVDVQASLATRYVNFLVETLKTQAAAVFDARRRAKHDTESQRTQQPRERGLHALLDLIAKSFLVSPLVFSAPKLEELVDDLLTTAERTTSKGDMRKVAKALGAVIKASKLPDAHLRRCLQVSCAILNAMPDLKELYWEDVLFLLSSSKEAIDTLLSVLQLASDDKHSHAVCGVLTILHFLVAKRGHRDLPLVSFSTFVQHISRVRLAGRRTRRDCLKSFRNFLEDAETVDDALAADWAEMVLVIVAAAAHDEEHASTRSVPSDSMLSDNSKARASTNGQPSSGPSADEVYEQVSGLSQVFSALWTKLNREQRASVANFYHQLKTVLPESSLQTLIYQIIHQDLWLSKTDVPHQRREEMLQLFVLGKDVNPLIYSLVLDGLKTSLPSKPAEGDVDHFSNLTISLLEDFPNHAGIQVANDLADFAAGFWKLALPPNLPRCLDLIWPLLSCTGDSASIMQDGSEVRPDCSKNTVTESLIGTFISCVADSAPEAALLFNMLLRVARERTLATAARLPAVTLLCRLRSDAMGIINFARNEDIHANTPCHDIAELNAHPPEHPRNRDRFSSNRESQGPIPSRLSRPSSDFRSSGRQNMGSRIVPEPEQEPLIFPPARGFSGELDPANEQLAQRSSRLRWHNGFADEPKPQIKASDWLLVVIDILQQGNDWTVRSCLLALLSSQLSNLTLFVSATPHIKHLRNVITSQLKNGDFPDLPEISYVKKGDVAAWLSQNLVMLLGYINHFARGEQDDIVRTFLTTLSGWDKTIKVSIHALATCSHVIPESLKKSLPTVLQKMSQIVTQSHLAVDVLEFLGGLARLPELYTNFREEEFRTVLGICVRYLEHSREKRLRLVGAHTSSTDYTSSRLSEISTKSSHLVAGPSRQADIHRELPQYVFALAYHVLTIWFLSLKLPDRPNYVGWITRNLVWRDHSGSERMEEQSQVTLDMMHRTAYLDLGETEQRIIFSERDGKILTKTWLVGLSLFTVETAVGTGLTKLIKRQASGTTYATYQQNTAPLPPHHVRPIADALSSLGGSDARLNIFPNHVFLQLMSNVAPMPGPMEPICLPDDETTKRAISAFDLNDTVDGYRVGVIYLNISQTSETEILRNSQASPTFETFLGALGSKVRLKGARFNTQGLDRETDADGEYTVAWRDRVVEIVFHVPLLMPTDAEYDPLCVRKKRHTGNDFVNIIFNESGLAFDFNTFPSQFNYVNIVITPERSVNPIGDLPRTEGPNLPELYYTIQTISQISLPEITAAASPKLVPLSALAGFARQLALHSAVFCNVWANREGGEHLSSWRNRLREIGKLRERFANTGTSTSAKYPGAKSIRTYAAGDIFKGTVEMGGLAEEEGILGSLDFSRWAGPNPPLG